MKHIPLYGIEKFKKKVDHRDQYQIDVFTKHRNHNVEYPHRHNFYEILFITQGTGTHTIDFNTYEIKPYSIFFLSSGQVHSLDLSDDINGFVFLFTSEFYLLNKQDQNKLLELPFFYSLSKETPPLYLKENIDCELFRDLFARAHMEYSEPKEDSEEIIRAFLDIILLLSKRLYPVQATETKKQTGKLLVKKFKQLIEDKYHENLSVKDYATILAVTPNHLNETVKNLTGLTATDLIRDKVIIEIKRMLQHTELTISEIAARLNFEDQSYFSKYFKKHTGKSPGEFRNQP